MQEINDWKVVLGFDDTAVKKGMKGVDKAMQRQARLNQLQSRDKGKKGVDKAVQRQDRLKQSQSRNKGSSETRNISRQNQLYREQEKLRKRIDQAKGLGIQGLNKYTGSLAIKDPVRMANKRLELERQIGVVQREQNIAAKHQAEALKIQKERSNEQIKQQKAQERLARQDEQAAKAKARQDEKIQRGRFTAAINHQKARERWARQDIQQRKASERLSNRRAGYVDSLSYLNQRTSSVSSAMPAGQASSLMARQAALGDQIRSAKSIEELNRLALSLRQVTRDTNNAIRKANQFTREMNKQQFAAKSLSASVHNLARSYLSIYAVGAGVKSFYDIGTDFDSMKAGLLAASGDAVQADKNFKFLLQTSKDLGINLVESARGFNKLGVAARSAGFDAAQIQEMHLAVAESAAAFQLDRSRQSLVFLAMAQMSSKARISLEELQRQLGDSLPTALDSMAKAYSDFTGRVITRGDLVDHISAGRVMSQDNILGFAKHLRVAAREGGALEAAIRKVRAEQERFMTSIYENIMRSFDQSAPLFASAWRDLNEAMERSAPLFNVFGKALGGLFKTIAFSIKLVTPVINIFGTALERVFGTFTHFFNTMSRGLSDTKQEFTSFEKLLLKIGAQFKYLESFVYGWLHALDQVSVWLAGTKEDNAFESVAKGVASWAIAIIPVLIAFKALAWTLGGILSIVKTLSGYNLIKKLIPKEVPTGAISTAKNVGTSSLKTGLRSIPYVGAAFTAGMAINDVHSVATSDVGWWQKGLDLYQEQLNQFPATLPLGMMMERMRNSQPVNINTTVELDGKKVGESVSPVILDNLYGQMEMESY